MENNMVNWFEIPVTDMARAKRFYTAVFGKELTDATMPGMEMAMFPWTPGAPHAAGCIIKADGFQPSATATAVYFLCDDVTNESGRIEQNGGKILVPKFSLGDWGFAAHILDSAGNRLGLHSTK